MKNPTSLESVSKCKLCATLGQDHVPSDGDPSSKIMVIGQSPGQNEVAEGRPFCGPSGELLEYLLDEVGITREQVYIANALKCRPPGNRPGSPREIELCRKTWLYPEVKYIKPKIILILGKDAYTSFFSSNAPIPFEHGGVYKTPKVAFLISYHPSYFLRRGDIEEFIVPIGEKLTQLIEENITTKKDNEGE